MQIKFNTLFCVAYSVLSMASKPSALNVNSSAAVTIFDDSDFELQMCRDRFAVAENHTENCSFYNPTLICRTEWSTISTNSARVRRVHQLIICSWPNATFDPSMLSIFPKLRTFYLEGKSVSSIKNNFPEMSNLENITIVHTQLRHIHSMLFGRLHALKFVDLRNNQFDHIDGPMHFGLKFRHLMLAQNPWNCSRNFKWILNKAKSRKIVDRDQLLCAEKDFSGKRVLTVTQYKEVRPNVRAIIFIFGFYYFDEFHLLGRSTDNSKTL